MRATIKLSFLKFMKCRSFQGGQKSINAYDWTTIFTVLRFFTNAQLPFDKIFTKQCIPLNRESPTSCYEGYCHSNGSPTHLKL